MVCFHADGNDPVKTEKMMFEGKRASNTQFGKVALNKSMVGMSMIIVMGADYMDIGACSWVDVEVEIEFSFDY